MNLTDLAGEGELTPADREELKKFLSNESLRRVLGHVVKTALQMDRLTTVNLRQPEGLSTALQAQGTVLGMFRAIDLIINSGEDNGPERQPNSE